MRISTDQIRKAQEKGKDEKTQNANVILDLVEEKTDLTDVHNYYNLPVSKIDFYPDNLNTFGYDYEGAVQKIMRSARDIGIQNAIHVVRKENGRYEVYDGNARTDACKRLYDETKEERFRSIPAHIDEISVEEERKRWFDSNKSRRDDTKTSPFDYYHLCLKAREIEEYEKKANKKQGAIRDLVAERVGISKTQVARYMLLEQMPESILEEAKALTFPMRTFEEELHAFAGKDDGDRRQEQIRLLGERISSFRTNNPALELGPDDLKEMFRQVLTGTEPEKPDKTKKPNGKKAGEAKAVTAGDTIRTFTDRISRLDPKKLSSPERKEIAGSIDVLITLLLEKRKELGN